MTAIAMVCPWVGCSEQLRNARVVRYGCLGHYQPVGECPWHGTLVGALDHDAFVAAVRELDGQP